MCFCSGVSFPVCEFEFCGAFDKNPLKMFEFCCAFDKKFAFDESQYGRISECKVITFSRQGWMDRHLPWNSPDAGGKRKGTHYSSKEG